MCPRLPTAPDDQHLVPRLHFATSEAQFGGDCGQGRAAASSKDSASGLRQAGVVNGGILRESRVVLTEHHVADLPASDARPDGVYGAGEVAAADSLARLSAAQDAASMSRATLGLPRMMCQSAALIDTVATFTSTFPAAGSGRSTFSSRSTSEVPYRSCTAPSWLSSGIARPVRPDRPLLR
jgi:hypothetical protein